MTDELIVGVIGDWTTGYDVDRLSLIVADGLGRPSFKTLSFAPRTLSTIIASLPQHLRCIVHVDGFSGPLWRMRGDTRRVEAAYWDRLSRELAAAGTEGAIFALLRCGSEVLYEPPDEVVICRSDAEWQVAPRFDQAMVLLKSSEGLRSGGRTFGATAIHRGSRPRRT